MDNILKKILNCGTDEATKLKAVEKLATNRRKEKSLQKLEKILKDSKK